MPRGLKGEKRPADVVSSSTEHERFAEALRKAGVQKAETPGPHKSNEKFSRHPLQHPVSSTLSGSAQVIAQRSWIRPDDPLP